MKTIFTIRTSYPYRKTCLVLISIISFLGATAQVYTPKGTFIVSSINVEMSQSMIDGLNVDVPNAYPQAEFKGTATNMYNCHAYAWHVSEGGSNEWVFNPTAYTTDGSYYEVTGPRCNTKVLYPANVADHSAVVTDNPNVFISKWAHWPLMKHHKDYGPYVSQELQYFDRDYSITGPDAFCSSGNYTIKGHPSSPTPQVSTAWSEYSTSGHISPSPSNAVQTTFSKIWDKENVSIQTSITYNVRTENQCAAAFTTGFKHNILVGFPYYADLGSGPVGNTAAFPYSHYHYYMNYPSHFPSASFLWTIPTSQGWQWFSSDNSDHIYVKTGPFGSTGPVEVAITACGVTRYTHKYVEVGYGNGPWEPDAISPGPGNAGQGKATPENPAIPGARMLAVTPNPARDQVLVTLVKRASTTAYSPSIREVRIVGNAGAVAKRVSFNNNLMSQRISVSVITAGMYVISVYDGRFWYTEKLVVVK